MNHYKEGVDHFEEGVDHYEDGARKGCYPAPRVLLPRARTDAEVELAAVAGDLHEVRELEVRRRVARVGPRVRDPRAARLGGAHEVEVELRAC